MGALYPKGLFGAMFHENVIGDLSAEKRWILRGDSDAAVWVHKNKRLRQELEF